MAFGSLQATACLLACFSVVSCAVWTRRNRLSGAGSIGNNRRRRDAGAGPAEDALISGLVHKEALHALREGMILRDHDGFTVDCNQRALEILQIERADLLGRKNLNLLGVAMPGAVLEAGASRTTIMEVLLLGRSIPRVAMSVTLADGSVRWLEVSSQPIFLHGEAVPAPW